MNLDDGSCDICGTNPRTASKAAIDSLISALGSEMAIEVDVNHNARDNLRGLRV